MNASHATAQGAAETRAAAAAKKAAETTTVAAAVATEAAKKAAEAQQVYLASHQLVYEARSYECRRPKTTSV
jgi:hypothetical protein